MSDVHGKDETLVDRESGGVPRTTGKDTRKPDETNLEDTRIDTRNIPDKPTLAETAAEAQRMTYAGRSSVSLRESKIYDSGRLSESPLFKSQGELF